MRFTKFFFSIALGILIFTFMVSYQSFSGTTGKISGFVKDAETGDPLPGVNVVLQGTTMGAATDIDGYYFVINIPPGTYTLKATMMGYQSQSVKISVAVDLTTKVNFDLKPTVMDLGEAVTVTAERPLIQPEITSKRAIVTADMIENMPVRSVQEIISLQSGVIMMDKGNKIAGFETRGIDQVHVRGGRSGEIAYMVDGMYVEDAIYAGMGTSVNREAIQELTQIIGASDAEYGEAQSAIVNIITKEGGTILNLVSEYNSSEIAGLVSDADNVRQAHQAIGSISGPVPFIKGMSFFISGEQSYGAYRVLEFDEHTYDTTHVNYILDHPDDPRYEKIMQQIKDGIITEVDDIEQLRNDNKYYYVGDVLREWHTGAWRKAYRHREDYDNDDFDELHTYDDAAGWLGLGFNKNWDITAKLAWRLSPSMKLIIPLHFLTSGSKEAGIATGLLQ